MVVDVSGVVPPEVSSLVDPDVDPRLLRTMAEDLRAAGMVAATALSPVATARPLEWTGPGREAYDGWVADVDDRMMQLVGVVTRAVAVMAECADVVARAARQTTQCRGRLRQLRAGGDQLYLAAFDTVRLTVPQVQLRAILTDYQQAWDRAAGAERDAYEEMRSATGSVPGRPRSFGDHVGGALAGVWRGAVEEPARGVWAVTGAAVTDYDAWQDTVAGMVRGWRQAVEHPGTAVVDTLKEAVAWDDIQDGAYGSAVGVVAAGFLPTRWAGRVVDPPGPDVAAPVVTPGGHRAHEGRRYTGTGSSQSLDDMLDLVDLATHEDLGHTLARHVDVTDADLTVRVTDGWLDQEGILAPTGSASRFTDRDTAELAITAALNARKVKLLASAMGGSLQAGKTFTTVVNVGEVVGRGVRQNAPTSFIESSRVCVVMRLDPVTQRPYIVTAYPEIT